MALNGNDVIVTVIGLSGTQCCAGAAMDDPNLAGSQCSIPCGVGGQGRTYTIPLICNSIGSHTVYVYASDPSTNGNEYKQTTITINDPPPASCPQFDLIAAGTTVLTHLYGSGGYPPGQTADGSIKISLRPRAAPAGTNIYLKIIDPPDAALYGTPHQNDDNLDPAAGTFPGGKTTTVTLPQSGTVDVVLTATSFASGDNYQVQASADPNLISDPNFVCDPNNGCQTTPVITAWKRIYIEMDEMYRNSLLLTERTLSGATVAYATGNSFRKGDKVTLVHAPSFSRLEEQDVDGFYSEDRTIVDVARKPDPAHNGGYAVTLDAQLAYPYYTDFKVGATQLGDAIADLTRNAQRSSDPLYQFDEQYVAAAFAEAFVEVTKASTSDVRIPLYENLPDLGITYVGGKWFRARDVTIPDNFGLAIAAATSAPLPNPGEFSLGTTGGPYSYVWRQNIDNATSGPRSKFPLTSGLNATTVSGEVLVHELAHQWNVNSTYLNNECDKNSYADPTKFCQGNGPHNSGQYGDGIVKFHYVGNSPLSADSGYITIRKTGEPRP